MAKEKQTRRMIAMALAAAVTMSSVPVVAFADVVDNGDGTSTKTETSTTESTTTSGPNTEGSDTKDAPTVTVTVTAHEKTDTTTSVTTDNATNETVSETVSKTDTDTTTEKTETSWKDESENKTVGFEGEKVETTVTETTMTTTTEGGETTTTTEDPDVVREHETNDETTTTVEKTENGTTTTVENVKTEDGTREDGTFVDSEVTTTTTTTTDAEGNVTETTTEDGEETIVTKEDVAVGDEGQPEVRVDLNAENDTNPDDDKITVVNKAIGEQVKAFEEKFGDNGVDYESKEVISEIERIVQAELSKEETKVEKDDTTLESIAPEDYDDKHYDTHEKITGFTQPDGLLNGLSPDDRTPDPQPEGAAEEGYNYFLSGSGDATWAAAPVFKNIVYVKDPVTGEAMKDDDGNYIIDEEKSQLVYAGSKAGYSGMNGTPGQIVLKDENGELFYTYCIDKETPTDSGSWYKVSNLEDSDYYPDEESANKLRAIVEVGYWGTAEGTGSLDNVKDLLRNTYDADDTVTVKDAKGNEHTYTVVDLIDNLKEHEALAVTQGAIWSYANGSLATQNGQDGVMVIGVQSAKKFFNGAQQDSPLNQYAPAYNLESDAIMKALYDCMMGLEGKAATDVVINEQNSIDNMTLVVGDKAESFVVVDEVTGESVDVNSDDRDDNDAYKTSVEFTLAFVPDKNDNIHVYVLDGDGNQMNDANGAPIIKKLAAKGSEDTSAITPNEKGVYTIGGLVFQENTGVEFSLQLSGIQNLDQGVYIYQAYDEDGNGESRNDSQTLVGIAGGKQEVTVTKSMELTFNVDDHKKVTATSKWHKSSVKTTPKDPTTPPGGGGGGDNPDPGTDIPDEEVPLSDAPVVEGEDVMDIVDEDVPMAEAPLVAGAEEVSVIAQTGDSNHMAGAFGGMFAALAGMFMLRRKKEN